MATLAERLKVRRDAKRERIAELRKEDRALEAAERAIARKEMHVRSLIVGKLLDEAGILWEEDSWLLAQFKRLATELVITNQMDVPIEDSEGKHIVLNAVVDLDVALEGSHP